MSALSPPKDSEKASAPSPTEAEVDIELELVWETPAPDGEVTEATTPRSQELARIAPRVPIRRDDQPSPEPEEGGGEAWEFGGEGAASETREPDSETQDRRLSLSDLGVGDSSAHWKFPKGNSASPSSIASRNRKRKQQLEARIEQEMAQKALERDVARGIGPGGPVLTALEGVTRVSSAPIRGYAVFQVTTDATGNVTGVRLMDSNGGSAQWAAVGHEVRRRLAGQRLRVGGKPTRLLVRIESTESLPSGADPGLAIDAFGIPIKKGEGKKSSKLSILTPPQFVEVEVPDPGDPKKKIKMPMFVPPNIFGGAGDLADIGSKRRRMVHSRVLRADALAPPKKSSARKVEGRQDPPAAPRED